MAQCNSFDSTALDADTGFVSPCLQWELATILTCLTNICINVDYSSIKIFLNLYYAAKLILKIKVLVPEGFNTGWVTLSVKLK